jgi:hypothetical protein
MARNNARRILPRILAIGVLVLALAGCVRFQADLTLTPANTVSGNIVVAIVLSDETDETRDTTLASVEQIATGLLGTLGTTPGVTTAEYEQDGYLGQRLTFEGVPLTAFSGTEDDALHFERVGDEYVFSGAIDFSGDTGGAEEAEDDGNLTVKLTFPGAITETDGAVEGTTVSWSTPIDQRLEMNARGSAIAPGLPIGLIIGGVAGLLLVIAIVAGILVLLSRRRKAAAAAATPATLDPGFATPPAVAPAEPKAPKAPRTPKAPQTPDA